MILAYRGKDISRALIVTRLAHEKTCHSGAC